MDVFKRLRKRHIVPNTNANDAHVRIHGFGRTRKAEESILVARIIRAIIRNATLRQFVTELSVRTTSVRLATVACCLGHPTWDVAKHTSVTRKVAKIRAS